jgi:hypothetical protein
MSRGPRRIERAIEAAFTDAPSRAFPVEDLVSVGFPGVNRVAKKAARLRNESPSQLPLEGRVLRQGSLEQCDGSQPYCLC